MKPLTEAEALRILELDADPGPEGVRRAYLALCRRYHPDRFAGDPEKVALATELLATVNQAYAHFESRAKRPG